MAPRRILELSPAARQELETMRDHDPKPYRRQRAAALLKIADGASAHWVAQHGLLKAVDVDAVYRWLDRYQAEGIAGLAMRPGRGRKAAFSPPQPR